MLTPILRRKQKVAWSSSHQESSNFEFPQTNVYVKTQVFYKQAHFSDQHVKLVLYVNLLLSGLRPGKQMNCAMHNGTTDPKSPK